jgi:hypothetical protein
MDTKTDSFLPLRFSKIAPGIVKIKVYCFKNVDLRKGKPNIYYFYVKSKNNSSSSSCALSKHSSSLGACSALAFVLLFACMKLQHGIILFDIMHMATLQKYSQRSIWLYRHFTKH